MKIKSGLLFVAMVGCLVVGSATAQTVAPPATNATSGDVSPESVSNNIILPKSFNDPIEPFNRSIWGFDRGLLDWVVRPLSDGYRYIVFKPARTAIGRFGYNLIYPDRLINTLLQGRWAASGEETERCLCNTVLGVGGLFDVATHFGVPKNRADCGQTFKKWGFQSGCFLMLPLFGPSDVRDGVGLVGDTAALPQTYFFPYDFVGAGVTANNFSDTVEASVCFSKSEADSYDILKNAWSFSHEKSQADMSAPGPQDEATLETLQAALFGYTNAEFPAYGKTQSVLVPTTGKKLDYSLWLHSGLAPIVYLVPGFGAHRLSPNELGLAELLYDNGFSVVCISSTFHPEFMENAASTELPSYPPADVSDVRVVLTEIDRHLAAKYPHRLGARALMGYSMGGFQSLCIAAQAATNTAPSVNFSRYVSIDSPVNLRYSVTNLDEYYRAALAWPAQERTAHIENTLLKVAALSDHPPMPGAALPFNATESKFLVGLVLRLTLRDVIFDTQLRHNRGVLQHPLKKSSRRAAYDEIMNYSFWDYITKFAVPYDKSRGIDMLNPAVSEAAVDLRTYTEALQANAEVRVIANRNDFLASEEDRAWMQATFPSNHVTLFEHGGHLGNLYEPAVQQQILAALDGLGAARKVEKKQATAKIDPAIAAKVATSSSQPDVRIK